MPVTPRFTVLLPVTRGPELLPYAIESALAQDEESFELLVICDGAPAATIECAREFAARDERVRVHPFPKGERHGEAHRRAVMQRADGEFVAQIADDDLWFPDHLTELGWALEQVDFATTLMTTVDPDDTFHVHPHDLGDEAVRARMRDERWNFFGPTQCGYRRKAYESLPGGWTPAPPRIWSDLHMWRKFLALDGLTFATVYAITSIKLDTTQRRDFTGATRRGESAEMWRRLRSARGRAGLRASALASMARDIGLAHAAYQRADARGHELAAELRQLHG